MDGISFTAIDFETANSSRLSACSIGLCAVDDGKIVKTASYLIKPPKHVGYFHYMQTSIHGITYKDVKNAGEFCDIWDEISPMLKNRVVAAHNMPFDRNVLKQLAEYYSLPDVTSGYICTLKLAKRAFPTLGSFKLDNVCAALGFPMNGNHHQAGADAEAAARILVRCAEIRGLKNMEAVFGYIGEKAPVSAGYVTANVNAVISGEKHGSDLMPEKTRTGIYGVPDRLIRQVIEHYTCFGEENGKPTIKQLNFMVKLRNEINKPISDTDMATRKAASEWISHAIEEKNRQNSRLYGRCR